MTADAVVKTAIGVLAAAVVGGWVTGLTRQGRVDEQISDLQEDVKEIKERPHDHSPVWERYRDLKEAHDGLKDRVLILEQR